ncbi:MAG: ABC transporter ATP-binding protein [bacterium]
MSPAIEVRDLVRRFGSFTAVDGVSFAVGAGEVLGFLGPNGAGKTTTIRVLTGIIPPSAGSASVLGLQVPRDTARLKNRIGYMSQRFSLYEDLTCAENLRFFGSIYGLGRQRLPAAVDAALAEYELARFRADRASDLPSGARQRLALACALLHDPGVLFLDEPTSGMDPFSRHAFWARVHALAARGKTVLVTTHYMDEAAYCHRLCLINRGRIVAHGTPDAVRALARAAALNVACAPLGRALSALLARPDLGEVSIYGDSLRLVTTDADRTRAELPGLLAAAGVDLSGITPDRASLEDIFVQLARAGVERDA